MGLLPQLLRRSLHRQHSFNFFLHIIMVNFTGKFTRVSAENYDEFLKALNVNFLLRKAATASTPVMEITESEGNKLITSQKALKKGEKDVTAVREFSDDKITMTMTVDGVSSVQVYKRDA